MLQLKLLSKLTVPLEAPCIAPDQFVGKAAGDIAQFPVQHGNSKCPLGEFFSITGDPSDGVVSVIGDCSRVKWLGSKMSSGKMIIHGPAGMHTGSGMTGGIIEVDGPVDDWLGAEMAGGSIHVHGDAGHHCAAAYPGSKLGMRGGMVLVDGTTGDGTAAVMRRGLVAVHSCGDFAGASMIAGSLFVFGSIGKHAGANMKRGSIVALGDPPELLPTFRPSCEFEPTFVELYLRRLRQMNFTSISTPKSFRRYCGDMVSLGLGEILVPA